MERILNEIVVYRKEYSNIEYNTKISNLSNCNIIIANNGTIRRINKIEKNIINPCKIGLFNINLFNIKLFNKNKIDENEYSVFHVSNNYFDCAWKNSIQYIDKRFGEIQEQLVINATYCFNIFAPEKTVLMLSDILKKYDISYFNKKINTRIDNILKNCISKKLDKYDLIKFQNKIVEITKETENIINDSVLNIYGIALSNLNISIEENKNHYTMRNKYEWEKLKKKEGKEIDNI